MKHSVLFISSPSKYVLLEKTKRSSNQKTGLLSEFNLGLIQRSVKLASVFFVISKAERMLSEYTHNIKSLEARVRDAEQRAASSSVKVSTTTTPSDE